MTKLPTIEQMLKAGMHFGHRTSKWHPKMEPFIFGAHGGVHIIDLVKSRKMLETALEFMKKFAAEGKMILFVGTKMQVKKPLKDMSEEVGMPYISEKWMGGCLTNFLIIKKLIKKYKDLLDDKNTGKLDKYTKKERLEFDREIKRLELRVGGLTKLSRLPDAIFVWDIKHEKTAVTEARKKNIPLIAICDTNVNPTGINYVIPANDDATKTIKLTLGLIKEAIEEGKAMANKK
ncbi:30S ribosomal protein S2 [Candidatus Falkowbacteria bacterium RIFOXYB2_FULL_47_14]|uniref:Small ribosomal subunit protein uS2 n=1 Tax=Candidatus Falkowbacteria bacterium RIFOXYA2_FULL_47_19 TaxID=1797994 RepID=A0A1F5SLM2_9BACT|nr:MAG: 30S ribosomal protein S2 [Candidatus Falkowbacteria bacterium RIFOXYA2_FULL_47_19]OGF34798.1 MAG: 30S ribosomal protein S2 [Candidatus Falkowbacteria bacterium RIFOXYC2_FULL_46_15]OGF43489.1 MAG: 30S ribosomal protein S2 [Candidatus Falkowbacteria bacterium RIFOXYB2_FULL_47_14]